MADLSQAARNPVLQCINWTGRLDRDGYGFAWINGRRHSAHRSAWQWANGRALLPGEAVLHRCDNPSCINPDHLRAGTQRENMQDMWSKGRGRNCPRSGEAAPLAKLTARQASDILSDARPNAVIARDYGVGASAVSCIKRGLTWSKDIAAYRAGGENDNG